MSGSGPTSLMFIGTRGKLEKLVSLMLNDKARSLHNRIVHLNVLLLVRLWPYKSYAYWYKKYTCVGLPIYKA